MIKLHLKLCLRKNFYFEINFSMKKKTIKILLEILKYGITLALGYLGKDTGMIDETLSLFVS